LVWEDAFQFLDQGLELGSVPSSAAVNDVYLQFLAHFALENFNWLPPRLLVVVWLLVQIA
jgi:hypothetical protein